MGKDKLFMDHPGERRFLLVGERAAVSISLPVGMDVRVFDLMGVALLSSSANLKECSLAIFSMAAYGRRHGASRN
jgi:hypothetical protein